MRQGFTLVELLISVILMVILLSAITMVFMQTTDTVTITDARTVVYTNARYAMETMANDLRSCVSFNEGLQMFVMENGVSSSPGTNPTYGASGGHVMSPGSTVAPADRISFVTTTMVGDTLQTCKVTYELIPGNKYMQGEVMTEGDQSHKETVRTKRGLYTLLRKVRVADPNDTAIPPSYNKTPVDRNGLGIEDQELCHYVVSFNLEYYDRQNYFSQLDPTPFPATDPLGDNKGPNDVNPPVPPPPALPPDPTALRIPCIRVTLVIVEDIGERQERTIPREMWIPMG